MLSFTPKEAVMIRSVVLSMLLLGFAGALAAQAEEPAPPAAQPQAAPQKEKLICRKEARSASRLGQRKVCKTAEEWAASDLSGDKGANEFFENKGTGNTEGPR
jgi:invasion protein IalB